MLEIIKLILEYIEINNATVTQHSDFVRKGEIEKKIKKLARNLDDNVEYLFQRTNKY